MVLRKRRNGLEFAPAARDLVGASIVLGVGSQFVPKVGGPSGGIVAAASFLPLAGTVVGAGIVGKQARKLSKRK